MVIEDLSDSLKNILQITWSNVAVTVPSFDDRTQNVCTVKPCSTIYHVGTVGPFEQEVHDA